MRPSKSYHQVTIIFVAILLNACGSDGGNSSSSSSGGNDCVASPAGSGYCLVWEDEFTSNELDLTKWSYERNCFGGGNNEAQCYVDAANNLWLDGDYLYITAIEEASQGPAVADDDPSYNPNDLSGSGTYTSARIRTKNKGDWRYGRFEIRAKLPAGQGSWPAIWMLPTDNIYGAWADSGEIDIMEAVNLKVGGESRVHGTLHYGDQWPANVYSGEAYHLPNGANPADDFHTYALEWELGEIRWYVDGDHYATQTQDGWYSSEALDTPAAPFNQNFHLILNLAVGGDWAANANETGIDASAFPQQLIVDYVRVYQCSANPTTGVGCATRDNNFVANPGVSPPEPVDTSEDELIIYNGLLTQPYQWLTYVTNGEILYRQVNIAGDYGYVAEMEFQTTDGIAFFQSPTGADLSGYNAISFDWRVINDPRGENAAFSFRADCIYPCTSGNFIFSAEGFNQWQNTSISLSELATAGLDLTKVNTPFIFAPSGMQNGVIIQVDNVKLTK